ncbi:MAG: class I SAM-dependent methyltransferase [Bdellovibrionota bacterium]
MSDHTGRFTGRVQNYIKYRPSYPAELVPLLKSEISLSPNQVVADVGSGTGILSKLLLDAGCSVIGVEPNTEMREGGDRLLAGYPDFKSVSGTAEKTGLGDRSVDLVTAAQAFHWFDPDSARSEFKRILKPGGYVVLVWNNNVESSPLWIDYESFLLEYSTDYRDLKYSGNEDGSRIQKFFGNAFTKRTLTNSQELDAQGFEGRFLSVSHSPPPGHPNYAPALSALKLIFEKYQRGGTLRIDYATDVFLDG